LLFAFAFVSPMVDDHAPPTKKDWPKGVDRFCGQHPYFLLFVKVIPTTVPNAVANPIWTMRFVVSLEYDDDHDDKDKMLVAPLVAV
jgi:hypothetical protein